MAVVSKVASHPMSLHDRDHSNAILLGNPAVVTGVFGPVNHVKKLAIWGFIHLDECGINPT